MICILAFIVFGILGIFSATHRKLAAEAFDCVFRRVTFRKCETGLDVRLKSQITGKVMAKSPKLAGFLYKYFEIFSWFLVILTFASFGYSIYGGINYYLYGNCYGPESDGFCIFDPTGEHSKVTSPQEGTCSAHPLTEKDLTINGVDLSIFPQKNTESKVQVIFVGCYACEYTQEAAPIIDELLGEFNPNLVWLHFPVKGRTEFLSKYGNCIYEQNPEEFWRFHDALFNLENVTKEKVDELAKGLNINTIEFNLCIISPESEELYNKQMEEIKKTNVYGTPTVFVNKVPVVGPKPYRVYARLME